MTIMPIEWVADMFGSGQCGKISKFTVARIDWRAASKDAPHEFPYCVTVEAFNIKKSRNVKTIEVGKRIAPDMIVALLSNLVEA